MKNKNLKLILGLLVASLTLDATSSAASHNTKRMEPLLHLDIEASGSEYLDFLKSHRITFQKSGDKDLVSDARDAGKRNLDWISRINASRKPEDQVRLTNPNTRRGIPPSAPKIYSDRSVGEEFNKLLSEVPASMKEVIFEGRNQSSNQIPSDLSVEQFIEWSRKVDKLYQTATRWSLLSPWLYQLEWRKREDIRGFYFLSRESDLETKLVNFSTLLPAEQERLGMHLKGICYNSLVDDERCAQGLNRAIAANQVKAYFDEYYAAAKEIYDGFFVIQGERNDIQWSTPHEDQALIFMQDPQNSAIRDFLKFNIEDEWKFGSWNLLLNFDPSAAVHVVFKPGVTPNVNGVGGNRITMDANASINEFEVQWTIRHEFGHVLGFPDCYIEFYDSNIASIVNYQIDTTDLMCSRAGNLKENHFNEMKRVYFKQ